MNFIRIIAVLFTVFLLAGCGKPVPAEKSSYVGEWRSSTMAILITKDGSLIYKRVEGGVTKTINAPLKDFEGDNFVAGIGPIETKFIVSAKPHFHGNVWRMTVDGVELEKVQ